MKKEIENLNKEISVGFYISLWRKEALKNKMYDEEIISYLKETFEGMNNILNREGFLVYNSTKQKIENMVLDFAKQVSEMEVIENE